MDQLHKDRGRTTQARAERFALDKFRPTQFKLWYIHQVGGPSYEERVDTPQEGLRILETVYRVALYQFANKMIPDYANTGGVLFLDADGEWIDWEEEDFDDR